MIKDIHYFADSFRNIVVFVAMLASTSNRLSADDAASAENSYRGLVPGVSTFDEVREALGPSPIETEKADDLRFPAATRPELNDRLYFRRGKVAIVTAASPDSRYPNRTMIVRQLGKPEAVVKFQTQEYLDYTQRGLRFICDANGQTTGTIHFPPTRRRVPAGYPNSHLDLSRAPTRPDVANAPADFRVGAAQASIAPVRFDNLTADGAQKPAHLAEDLFARAVVFERADTRLVIVGLDVFGLGTWDVDALRESLAEKGFPNVLVAMSHTHANVDTIGFYGYYPREYAKHVLRQTESAVRAAAESATTIESLKVGSTEMSLAGGRVVDLIRNGRDPGLVDPTVSVLQAIGNDGEPIVNLIHLACHPEVIRLDVTRGLSPDFVGALCNDVSDRLGGQSVFLNGALGGMLTPDTRFRTQQAAEEMGRRLARYVVRAAETARASSRYDLWIHRRPVEYPITGESVTAFLQNAPEPIDFFQGRVRAEMNAVWIGDAQLITVPGELLPDIGLEIMSRMPGHLRLVVGLTNGELGYLVPSFDFRAGEYEERTGPGAAGGPITRSVGLELAPLRPPSGN